MCVIKTIKLKENITINIHDEYIPHEKEEEKKNIQKLYDILNDIFCEEKDRHLFYTDKELKKYKGELV